MHLSSRHTPPVDPLVAYLRKSARQIIWESLILSAFFLTCAIVLTAASEVWLARVFAGALWAIGLLLLAGGQAESYRLKRRARNVELQRTAKH